MFNLTDKHIKKIILEEINGESEEYSGAGECDHDFFGILLGYLGGDEYIAREFCEMARSDNPGDTLTMAMEEFNISPDAEYEIRQAYAHIFGEQGAFGMAPENIHERKNPMKITKTYLRKIVKEELESELGGLGELEPWRSPPPGVSLDAMGAADDEKEVDQAIALSAEEEAILAKLLPKLNITTNAEGDIIIPAKEIGPLKRALAMGPGRGEGPRDGYDSVLTRLTKK